MKVISRGSGAAILLPMVIIFLALIGCGQGKEKEKENRDEPKKIGLVEFPTQPYQYELYDEVCATNDEYRDLYPFPLYSGSESENSDNSVLTNLRSKGGLGSAVTI